MKGCCTLKKKGKYGFASDKIERPRTPSGEEEGVMLTWLKRWTYDLMPPRNYVDSKTEKEEYYTELKDMKKKYKDYRIINTITMEHRPKDAKWLNFPICITQEKGRGIPVFDFLAYVKGGSFIRHYDAKMISAKAGISPDQVEEACGYFVNYLRGEICKMHEKAWRDPAVRQCYGAAPIYNYTVEASSGATVNINN